MVILRSKYQGETLSLRMLHNYGIHVAYLRNSPYIRGECKRKQKSLADHCKNINVSAGLLSLKLGN